METSETSIDPLIIYTPAADSDINQGDIVIRGGKKFTVVAGSPKGGYARSCDSVDVACSNCHLDKDKCRQPVVCPNGHI